MYFQNLSFETALVEYACYKQQLAPMIRPPFRNRIDRDKISRHSSQVAIRKTSTNSRTQANSETQELRNIRQTTFWVKKTVGVPGLESMPFNNKRIGQSRDRQVLSIKLNTDHSDTDSTCQRLLEDREKENLAEQSTKLALFLKSQTETGAEVNVVANQNLPKLTTCHKLFSSLNKILKLAANTCSHQFVTLVANHIEYSNLIFEKVLSFSHDFIAAQKSHNLITKNIELEKENSQLMTKCTQPQILEKTHKEQQPILQKTCFRKIDVSKLYANHNIREFECFPSEKCKEYCKKLLRKGLDIETQVGHFELVHNIVEDIMNCKQGKSLLKEFTRKQKYNEKGRIGQNIERVTDLSKSTVNDVLCNKFDFAILDAVRQKIRRSMHYRNRDKNEQKIQIKQVLSLMNEFMILKDINKTKSIMCQLLAQIQIVGRVSSLTCTQLKQIEEHIEQASKTRWTNKSIQIVSQKSSLSRLSSKRFVNCANLYGRKPSGKNKQNVPQSETVIIDEQPSFLKSAIQTTMSEAVLVCYNFVHQQMQHLTSAISVITSVQEDILPVINIYDKLMIKQLSNLGKINEVKQKQALLLLSHKIGKHYACDHLERRELILKGSAQLSEYMRQQSIDWLKQGQKLILPQCDDTPLTLIS